MNERRFQFWQWGVLAAALAVRLPQLAGSFWLDEAAQALESARPLTQQLQLAGDFQPPLYHLIVALLVRVSTAEAWLRLASLIPALLTVWLTVKLARRWLSPEASLAAGAAVAFSNLHIFYSQELRPYSLAVFWAVLAWDLLERRHWRSFCLAVTAGIFTSYVYLFWPLGLLAVSMINRQLKTVIRSLAVSGLFFLAWWPSFLGQLRAGAALRTDLPGWEAVVSLPQMKALVLVPVKFLTGVLPLEPDWRYGVLLGAAGVWLGLAVIRTWLRSDPARRRAALEWLVLLASPLFAAGVVSFVTPVVQPKRLLFLLPPAAVLLGWLARNRGRLGPALFGLYLIVQLLATAGYWTQPALQRENWRGAIAVIDQTFSPENTAVVFGFSGPFAPWDWYTHQPYVTYSTGLRPLPDLEAARIALAGIERYRYVIVFDYLRDLTDPYRLIEARLAEMKYRRLGEYTYPNLGVIRVFEQNQLYAGVAHGPS
jgi:hypothetical protein